MRIRLASLSLAPQALSSKTSLRMVDIPVTTTDPLSFVSQEIITQLSHLNVASRLAQNRQVVSGGAYGDIFRGRCSFPQGSINVAIKCLRFYLKEDIKTVRDMLFAL